MRIDWHRIDWPYGWSHVVVQRILRDMNVVQKGCLFLLLICASVFRGESQVELCVDESLVDPGAICPTVFDLSLIHI